MTFALILSVNSMFKAMKIRYDDEKNSVIVQVGDMTSSETEVEISLPLLREHLPKEVAEMDMILELQKQIHKIRKTRLLKIEEYIKDLRRIAKGVADARKGLQGATKKVEVDQWKGIVKSWTDEKNILKEYRMILGKLDAEEQRVRDKLAKLQAGVE